ncbi:TAA7E-like protein [Mya arenaria]|uniref:TAA7E-like protein n=1 Tax=Mya arenaria TaxID=6604 RepID=A0ABY7G5F3_MYAAR|nr:TAA7E-like protein [Mya arenaria]
MNEMMYIARELYTCIKLLLSSNVIDFRVVKNDGPLTMRQRWRVTCQWRQASVMPYSTLHLNCALCDVYTTFDVHMCTSSILHLCTISLERFIVIRNPLESTVHGLKQQLE